MGRGAGPLHTGSHGGAAVHQVHSCRVTLLAGGGAKRSPCPSRPDCPLCPVPEQAAWGAYAGADPSYLLAVPRARRFSSGGEDDDFDRSMHKVSRPHTEGDAETVCYGGFFHLRVMETKFKLMYDRKKREIYN